MKKKILNTILFIIIIICVTGCSKNANISEEQLNNINDKIIAYFSSDNVEYNNLSFNYVDTINKKVVVGLLDNSKEEQEKFKKLVVDSEYIVFIEGGKLINNSN
ncbi:MAG: hypothetical protein ACI310_07020 [Bacilli bacterium]